jgi:hypothetical protein
MEVVRGLMTTTDPELAASLRGVGRRSHEHQGGLRLTGLFSEPVIANTGMAGVVTYTASSDGALWSVPAVTPGGPERVQAAYRGPVGLGGAALDHRELVRGGLVVSGAASSADGSLSHGKGVRSVRSSGATWWEPPLDKLFATPPTDQLERIFTGSERQRRTSAAADVLFCEITVLPTAAATRAPGSRPGDVPVHLGGGAEQSSGMVVLLRAASDHDTLAYAHNLSVLSQAPGLRLRLAARPDPIRVGVLYALAAAPDPAQAALHLPEPWHSRICLGLDHLHDSMIRASTMPTSPPDDGPAPEGIDLPPGLAHFAAHIPLHLLRAAVERVAAGGRATARATPTHRETARLRAAGLPNAAAALDRLTRTAAAAERDAYARPIPSAVSDFAEAWLAAGLYEAAASAELTVHGWRGVSTTAGRDGS